MFHECQTETNNLVINVTSLERPLNFSTFQIL
jgi:hypothetical protein